MMSLRSPLTRLGALSRTYVTATKKTVTPRKTSTKTTKTAAAATTPAPAATEDPFDVPDDVFFDPPEFGLQVGQSQRQQPPPNGTTSTSPLGSKTLDEMYKMSLHDTPPHEHSASEIHWPTSFFGLGTQPFPEATQKILAEAIDLKDIEIKPEGLIYLPEIKYRRILNRAFGAGGWGLVPRSETIVTPTLLTREYALICMGRLVSVARGEQDYFNVDGIPTATEGCRSNALMRCCKDLGIASELWDPNFIREFKKAHCEDKFVEHVVNKRKKKIWKRKDRTVEYPFKLT